MVFEMVNAGDLTVEVPVKVQDEIGFLAGSFNHMVQSIREARVQLEDYAANLEEKVNERTEALNQTLGKVQALKVQQDGDYFLTSAACQAAELQCEQVQAGNDRVCS